MGRGNICVHGEFEGLFYLNNDLLDVYVPVVRDDCGSIIGRDYEAEPMTGRQLYDAGIKYSYDGTDTGWAYDDELSDDNWRNMIELMQKYFTSRFKSFTTTNKWRGTTSYSSNRDCRVVLENEFFDIAIADNEWSAAWMLLEKEDIEDNVTPLMKRHYQSYLNAIKEALLKHWGEATEYGGAWLRGITHKVA